MSLSIILSFSLASFLLAIMPGPDNLLLLTESLSKHYKNGIALALGMNSGVMIHTLAAATGISLILQSSALAFNIVKIIGALYLLYLAYLSWMENQAELNINPSQNKEQSNYSKLFKQGFLMNVLNPKVSLFFIALLPQFIQEDGPNPIYQMIVLGAVFMVIGAIVFSSIALMAVPLKQFVKSARFWKIVKWSKVTVLLILAIGLLMSTSA